MQRRHCILWDSSQTHVNKLLFIIYVAPRWDHLHGCFASCTAFQGMWKNGAHIYQSLSSQQADGWILFVIQARTSVQKLNLVIKAWSWGFPSLMICSNPQVYRITTIPVPHQHRLLSEPQASPESSTTMARPMLPGEKWLTHQTTQSLRERSVKHKSCKEKQLSPTSCITADKTEEDDHVHTTSLVLHINFGEPGASHITIILLVFPLSLS